MAGLAGDAEAGDAEAGGVEADAFGAAAEPGWVLAWGGVAGGLAGAGWVSAGGGWEESGVCPAGGCSAGAAAGGAAGAGWDLMAAASTGSEIEVMGRVSVCTVEGSSRSFR